MAPKKSIIPGFGLTLGYTLSYICLILLIPLALLFLNLTSLNGEELQSIIMDPRVIASFQLSMGASFCGALINGFFGLIIAWVLVRYEFPGKRVLDALVDLPFAMPTAVAGISLTTLYAGNGWLGRLLEPLGIKVAFAPLGIIVALTFIGIPFVVRSVQPVLHNFETEYEEAAASLGANRLQTFCRVILPALLPSWITGFSLAFARALGEYGSVVFISGNMPFKTEIVPLLIVSKLEQYDYQGATVIALFMLVLSFLLLLAANVLQWWNRKQHQA